MRIINVSFHGIGNPRADMCSEEQDVWLDAAHLNAVLAVCATCKDVYITVDDGNMSDVGILAPALKEREMSGTFFVPVGLLGKAGYMSKQNVRQLAEAGFLIGSHGMGHVDWRKLSNEKLKPELQDSRRMLEQIIGQTVDQASCPFGSYDRRVLRFLKEGGYKRVYTSDRGIASQHAWLQARNTIHAWDDGEFVQRVLAKGQFSPDFLMCKIKTAIKRLR